MPSTPKVIALGKFVPSEYRSEVIETELLCFLAQHSDARTYERWPGMRLEVRNPVYHLSCEATGQMDWHQDGELVDDTWMIVWADILPTDVRDDVTKEIIPTEARMVYLIRNSVLEHRTPPAALGAERWFARGYIFPGFKIHDRRNELTTTIWTIREDGTLVIEGRVPGEVLATVLPQPTMSKYLTFGDVCFPDKKLLLAALKAAGYANVETGDKLHLVGYQGDQRAETADVVIRRRYVGSASNDIGFAKTKKGYIPIISQYDSGAHRDFLPKVRTEYGKLAAKQVAKQLGGVLGKPVTKGTTTQMVLTY